MSPDRVFVDPEVVSRNVSRAATSGDETLDHQFAFREPSTLGLPSTEVFDRAIHAFSWRAAQVANGSAAEALSFSENMSAAAEDLGATDSKSEQVIAGLKADIEAGSTP